MNKNCRSNIFHKQTSHIEVIPTKIGIRHAIFKLRKYMKSAEKSLLCEVVTGLQNIGNVKLKH